MAIGPKIEKISFYDPLILKNPPNIILVPKYFYIWGINDIKIFSELIVGFWSYPHFHFFKI